MNIPPLNLHIYNKERFGGVHIMTTVTIRACLLSSTQAKYELGILLELRSRVRSLIPGKVAPHITAMYSVLWLP